MSSLIQYTKCFLFCVLCDTVCMNGCCMLPPTSFVLYRSKYSLNALSHDAAIGLIRKTLADGVNLTEVCWYVAT